ncbi:hypothetical protein KP509_20G077300 [Ceratopteris richardii]|uniref:Serine aminopeptidase S33 domain-containing protein n=1 Tax=Ceratopteris richardii TaxID=49495 RepID=A0A8T2SGI8_CERRI|nr:hypothetical protein KP509_20G077300 [Ceratopteris richardii]
MADADLNFWGDMPENEYYASQGVINKKEYVTTPNGRLFTQSWLPAGGGPIKGVVCCTHGYGSTCSWMFQKIPISIAQWGYAAYAADVPGHGRSDGLRAYVDDIERFAATLLHFYGGVRDREAYRGVPKYLFGESMGGGITLLMLLKERPGAWDGAMFSAPLFEMPTHMKPSRLRLFAYGLLLGLADTWAVMPFSNMVQHAVRDPAKAKVIAANPMRYQGPPRVGTMRELSRMCDTIRSRCHEVDVPILLLHGTADDLATHEGSQMVHERAKSSDKTIKLYEGMYHSLIQGESDENVIVVLGDMRHWIDSRSAAAAMACESTQM